MHVIVDCTRIVIIGAGPCGLGAAWRLQEFGYRDFVLLEKENHVGGLASSYVDANVFTWDVGGHVIHSHYPYFDRVFQEVTAGEYLTHERESWIWIYDRFVPYPFQNNIRYLPPSVIQECLDGLKEASAKKHDPETFAEWIVDSFGSGIAKHFLFPYNRKVWAYPLEKMSYQWVGDRVASVDITRIELNIAEKKDDVSWGPNAVFEFPTFGGTGSIWEGVANRFRSHIRLNAGVTSIDALKRQVICTDGSVHPYDVLLTTMPIDRLTGLTTGLTGTSGSEDLHFSSVFIVGIGVKGDTPAHLRGKCWMYFPEDHAPFFRATVFSHYSPHNAPKGTWSLMTETSVSRYQPLANQDIVASVIDGAKKTGLIGGQSTVVDTWKFTTNYGYPTPTLGRDQILDRLFPIFEKHNIFSRGRFGAWRYEVSNQDHTFMQGVEWVNKILNGEEEVTVFHPELVNAKK